MWRFLINFAILRMFLIYLSPLIIIGSILIAYIVHKRKQKKFDETMDELDDIEQSLHDYEEKHREPPKDNIIKFSRKNEGEP